MTFTKWKNQYIELVNSSSEYIINCGKNPLSAPQKELLAKRISSYARIIVELGSGSGAHLLEQASQNPDTLYVGFEIRFKRTFRTAQKAEKAEIRNLLLLRANAERITEFFGNSSIQGFYVNFPDPWDKKRWHKHRMLNSRSLNEMHALLKPGGFISYKTDHQGYFKDTRKLLCELNLYQICQESEDLHNSDIPKELRNIRSEFEMLFISKGLPVYFIEVRKS